MNNFSKVAFNKKYFLLSLPNISPIKIKNIYPKYLELDKNFTEDSSILTSLYYNKNEIEKCIRNCNFDDEYLQKVCKEFEFEYIVFKNLENEYCQKSLSEEVLLKKVRIGQIYGCTYIFADFQGNIFYRDYTKKVPLVDISNDTIYISYELYNVSTIKYDISMLLQYKKQIEEYINTNYDYDKFIGKHISSFIFNKINVYIECTKSSVIIDTGCQLDDIDSLFKIKDYHFYNYMPRYFCDGSPTFSCEFDNLKELEDLLKSEEYLKKHLFGYSDIEDISKYELNYSPSLSNIKITLKSSQYKTIYHIGYIYKNSNTKIDHKIVLEDLLKTM